MYSRIVDSMNESGTFDRLASTLSMDERRELLGKLSALSDFSRDRLYKEEDISETVDIEQRYQALSWFSKLLLMLIGVFKNKSPVEIYEDRLILKLGARIHTFSPGFFDPHRNMLLPGFLEEVKSLRDSARFFYDILDTGIGRDKGAFFAFLGSLEMDYTHRRLLNETDPIQIANVHITATENEVRQYANKALDEIIQGIDEEQRRTMYGNARSLQCLKELSSYLFDRFTSAFSPDQVSDGPSCPAYILHDQLCAMNNILYSLQDPPSIALLESLFVFTLQEKMHENEFDMNNETKNFLRRSEEALSRIRQFNERVPLTDLIRCTGRNLAYFPQAISGGEDWFVVYKEYWKRRIDENYNSYVKQRRKNELSDSFKQFLKGAAIRPLDFVQSEINPEGVPVRKAFSLSFLATFYKAVFMGDLNKTLKPILIDGEFYKRENRAEFTEAYNELLKLGDTIRGFDQKLSPTGDIGKRYAFVRSEISALPVKRRKTQALIAEAAEESEEIIEHSSKSLRSMVGILGGILQGEPGGRYDSLVNLGSLAGKSGSYVNALKAALQKIEKAIQLLIDIDAIESNS